MGRLAPAAGAAEFGATPPAFADGTAKRVTEDGRIGPETLTAAAKHAAESGMGRVREAVALVGLERGLGALAAGEIGAEEAPAVFRRSVGRLYRDPNADAPTPADWAAASRPRHAAKHPLRAK